MAKPIIQVENIGKQYRLGNVGTGTLSHDINRWWHAVRGKEDPYLKIGETNDRTQKGGSEYVWALQDINFEVKQGEILGIIGKNGAGKSTLLKLLSRVTAPTTGKITCRGSIASLLEVGTGFHPELTGRENVYLNGAVLGMTKSEIAAKFDEIVEFAGCAKYIDTPVKRYSSGMTVRLGFAVAAHLEPDILVVDEVLAVGDAEFQKKAIGKMQEVSKGGGRTVLFVSHNMSSIKTLCTRVIVFQNGNVQYDGDTDGGIKHYLSASKNNIVESLENRKDRSGNGILTFQSIEVKSSKGGLPQTGVDVNFNIKFNLKDSADNLWFRLIVIDEDDIIRFVCNNYHSKEPFLKVTQKTNSVNLRIPKLPLLQGKYFCHLQGVVNNEIADEIEYACYFDVNEGDFYGSGKLPGILKGVLIEHEWSI